jgi:hypothetical protein
MLIGCTTLLCGPQICGPPSALWAPLRSGLLGCVLCRLSFYHDAFPFRFKPTLPAILRFPKSFVAVGLYGICIETSGAA